MAAMLFPCNGILVVLGNLPRIFPMSSLIYASFLIPYFNWKIIFGGNGLALCFNKFEMYSANIKCSNMIHQKKNKKDINVNLHCEGETHQRE